MDYNNICPGKEALRFPITYYLTQILPASQYRDITEVKFCSQQKWNLGYDFIQVSHQSCAPDKAVLQNWSSTMEFWLNRFVKIK